MPTFDFTSGVSGSGTNTITQTVSGVTATITITDDNSSPVWSLSDFSGASGTSGNAVADTDPTVGVDADSVSITFSSAVSITSFVFADASGGSSAYDTIVFTPNSGSAVTATAAQVSDGEVITPSDWTSVTSITITATLSGAAAEFGPVLDTIQFAIANSAPDLGGTPADDTADEDVTTAIDLSAYNVSDGDGDTITLTLAVDRGTIASVDGNGTFDGVTVANSDSASMTLQGTAANLNTYLNDTSHITFTTAANDTTTAVLTVTPNDGTENGTADTVNITINAQNDAPVLDNSQSPTLTGISEDAGDDDGSGADGDDDASNNSNNQGTTIASMVVDASITDADGSAVEAIAVTAVDNTNGVWQYSTDSGTSWNNFSGSTGSSVDISSASRLLASTALVRFVPDANYNGSATITFRAWDQSSGSNGGTADTTTNGGTTAFSSAADTASVTVTSINDNPTVASLPASVTAAEDTLSDIDLSAATFADVDSASITVTLTASAGTFATPADGASVGAGVTEALQSATVITLAGSPADISTYLDTASNIRYTPASNVSGNAAATITVTANDGDGSGDVSLGTVNVNVTAVNDNPALTGLNALTVTEGDAAAFLDSDITFSDQEDNFNGSTLTISGVLGEDILTIANIGTGSGQIGVSGNTISFGGTSIGVFSGGNGTDLVITLNGNATSNALDALLEVIQYQNNSDVPTANRTFTFTLDDEDGAALTGESSVEFFDQRAGVQNPLNLNGSGDNTFTFVDIDGDGDQDAFRSDHAFAANFYRNDGSNTTPSFSLQSEGDNPLSGINGQIDFVDIDNDGDFDLFAAQSDGTVEFYRNTGTSISPTFIQVTGSSNPFNGVDEEINANIEFVDIDGDGDFDAFIGDRDTTNFYRNTGDRNSPVFSLDSNPGLTGSGGLDQAPFFIDFDQDGDFDVFVGGTSGGIVYYENTGTANNFQFSLRTGSDNPFDGLDFGDDSIVEGVDIDADGDIDIFVSDANPNTIASFFESLPAAQITVNVTAVNDLPTISGLDGTPAFTEDGSAIVLDSNVTVADIELDSLNNSNGNFAGASLTIVRNGGANSVDTFSIITGGNLTVSGSNVSASGNVIATFDTSSAGQVTITFADNGTTPTGALVDEVLQAVRYSNGSNDPSSNVQLDWTFSDGNSANAQGTGDNPGTASGSVTVSITNVNDAPTLTATGGNPTFTEGGAAQDLFNTVSASTIESADRISSFTMTVTNVADGASEIISFDGTDLALTNGNAVTTATNSLSVSVSVSGSTATVSFTGASLTNAQFQTLVDALTYRNTSDNPTTTGNRVVTITGITDTGGTANGGSDSAAPNVTSTVTLADVNDPPVIGSVGGESSSVTAGAGATNIDLFDDATITNADSADYNGGFLTISQNSGTTNGSWSVDGTTVTSGGDGTVSAGETIQVSGVSIGTVNGTNDGQGGNTFTINLNASATSANVQTLLRNLNYSGPSGLDARTFTLTLNDNDGTANGGDEDATANFTINVTPNPPVIGSLDGDSLTFTENDSATAIDVGGNATVTDADSTNFNGGSLSVTFQSGQQSEDRLVIDTSGSVSLSGGQTAGSTVSVSGTAIGTIQSGSTGGSGEGLVISLTANATPTLTQALLQAVQYNNTGGDNPTDGDRTIRVTISDGSGATSSNADVTVNVNPVNDAPTGADGTETATEDTTFTFSAADFGFSDVDNGDTLASVRIDTLPSSAAGALQLSGSNVTAGDTITAANIANLTFVPAANANGTGAASFTFSVNDGTAFSSATNTITMDITAVNDLPTVNLAGLTDLPVTEDTSSSLDLSTISFADVEGDSLTVTLSIDAGTFASPINGSMTGAGVTATLVNSTTITLVGSASDINTYLDNANAIRYTGTSNAAGDNVATLTITPNDGTANGTAATVNIDITAVNDDPTGTGLPSDVSFAEDTAGNLDLSAVTLADVDAGTSNVTVTLTASEGALTASSGGSVTVSGSTTSTLTLTGTVANIDAFLNTASNIQYQGSSNDNGNDTATVTVTINDGGNTGSGGGTTITVGTVNADISAVNDAPTATDGTASINTNGSYTFSASDFNFSDVDTGNSLTSVRIDTLTLDNGTLQLNNTDVTAGQVIALADIPNLVYTPSGTGDDTFTFSVNDGTTFAASTSTFTVSVSQGNLPPSSLNLSGGSVAENAEGAVVGTLSGTDPDGDAITFTSLDSRFVVVGNTLRLADGVSLDFETEPTVRVGVRATATGGSLARTFTIAVTDVRETITQTGGDSNDTLIGGNDDDSVDGGGGDDRITTSSGRDTIDGGLGNDTIDGGDDDDSITGGDGDDEVIGNTGRDSLKGGAGNDTVNGGDDDDEIFSGNDDFGNDSVGGDSGNDTVGGGRGNDTVFGGDGNDIIFGGRGDGVDNNDIVDGGDGNDSVFGGSGDDTVNGGAGDDELWGGSGDDDLTGGAGADTFVFGQDSGNDTITDFNATEDRLDLRFAATDFASLADVTAAASETTQNGQTGVLIDLGDSQSVFIQGIALNDLSVSNVTL